jgi:acetyltransferase-like isoleucine patch superfamily enzyme
MKYIKVLVSFFLNIFSSNSSALAVITGENYISEKARVFRFAKIHESRIGSFSYIGPRTRLNLVDVGKYCSISWGCEIGLASHPVNIISTSPLFYEKSNSIGYEWVSDDLFKDERRVIIGSDVWIGADVKILSGVTIGDGSVIGVGAVVTKNVPPYAIVAGVPARIIRYRFDDHIIEQLLRVKWWDLPENYLKLNIEKFAIHNPTLNDLEWMSEDCSI